jgi:thiamine-phosphate pyrophosphorylase
LIESRNVEGDILRQEPEKGRREGVGEVLIANLKRGEESARVLEEIFKLLDPNWASTFKKIRYTLYQLEKEIILLGIEKEGKNFFGKKGENG